jgi:hypothetical protein
VRESCGGAGPVTSVVPCSALVPCAQTHLSETIASWLKTEERPILTLNPAEWEGKHEDPTAAAALGERVLAFAERVSIQRAAQAVPSSESSSCSPDAHL